MDKQLFTAQEIRFVASAEDVAAAVEAERRRIAGLLQSRLIDSLHTLLAQVSAYEQTLNSNLQARTAVAVLGSLARQLLQQALSLQADLHPTALEALGLETALEMLADQEMRAHGVHIQLIAQRLRERPSPQTELALFRAAQDALYRAIYYGRASRISMQLQRQDEQLIFTCDDNGSPVNHESLHTSLRRIQAMGGTWSIQTRSSVHLRISFPSEQPVELTEREHDILRGVIDGLGNKAIAAQLHISPRTVKFHLDNIYSKLGVNSRTEAAVYALRHGYALHGWTMPDQLEGGLSG